MKYAINAKITNGPMEYRTTEYETVALARTRKEAIKKAEYLADQHPTWSVCCVDTKKNEIIF